MDQPYSEPLGETWKYDPEYHRVSEFLGVNQYDREDSDLHKKVSAIRDWTGGKNLNEQLLKIEDIRKKSGHQFIGKPLINALYQNIRLTQDTQQSRTLQVKAKPKTALKQNSLQKVVADTVQQSVAGMVKQALGDKKLIQGTVQNMVKEALNGR